MSSKKVVIVTGASAGIGRAVAIKYAKEKYNLVLVALEGDQLSMLSKDLKAQYGADCLVCAGDLADAIFLRSIISQTIEKWNAIHVLVNNAAWRTIETMRSMELQTWERTLSICLTAPAFLAKWSAEAMERNNIPGTIINISSVMSERAGGISPAYSASKGALESLTYELAVTYGRSFIRVVCVQPGNVDTNMNSDYTSQSGENVSRQLSDHVNDLSPLPRAGTPEEIAEAIYWVSSENASFVTGITLKIDGGLSHNFNAYSVKKIQFPNEF